MGKPARLPSRLDLFARELAYLQQKHGLVLRTEHDPTADFSFLGREVPDPVLKVYELDGSATDDPVYRGTLALGSVVTAAHVHMGSSVSVTHRRKGKLPKGVDR